MTLWLFQNAYLHVIEEESEYVHLKLNHNN